MSMHWWSTMISYPRIILRTQNLARSKTSVCWEKWLRVTSDTAMLTYSKQKLNELKKWFYILHEHEKGRGDKKEMGRTFRFTVYIAPSIIIINYLCSPRTIFLYKQCVWSHAYMSYFTNPITCRLNRRKTGVWSYAGKNIYHAYRWA